MHRRTPSPRDPVAAGEAIDDVITRRSEVVQRLLALGVSAYTLEMLLPDWGPMIAATQPLQSGNPT